MLKKLIISLIIFSNCSMLANENIEGLDGLLEDINQQNAQISNLQNNEIQFNAVFQVPQPIIDLPNKSIEVLDAIPKKIQEFRKWVYTFLRKETDQITKKIFIWCILFVTAGISVNNLFSKKESIRLLAQKTLTTCAVLFVLSNYIAKNMNSKKWQSVFIFTILVAYNNDKFKPYFDKLVEKLTPKINNLFDKLCLIGE